jgi:hypothetical protein
MLRCLPVLLLLAAGALASTAVQMDVPGLTRAASDVVRVRVSSSRSAWTEGHRHLITLVEVEVLERWKGSGPWRLQVVQPGGELDGVGQRVAGVPALAAGEEAVLFLERHGPGHSVVGLAQGVYRVERTSGEVRAVPAELHGLGLVAPQGKAVGPRRPVSLDALKDEVRREVEQR